MTTKTEKAYLDAVASLSCAVCGAEPVHVHHVRNSFGMAQRAPHFLTIPLCAACHTGENGVHGDRALLRIYKTNELDLLADTIRRVFER